MRAHRGEVWLARLDPVEGHEQAGTRPVLIMSIDSFNASPAQLVMMIPMTSKARPGHPFHIVETPTLDNGLTMMSSILCEQPRTLSTQRLQKRLGMASPSTVDAAANLLRTLLGL